MICVSKLEMEKIINEIINNLIKHDYDFNIYTDCTNK